MSEYSKDWSAKLDQIKALGESWEAVSSYKDIPKDDMHKLRVCLSNRHQLSPVKVALFISRNYIGVKLPLDVNAFETFAIVVGGNKYYFKD